MMRFVVCAVVLLAALCSAAKCPVPTNLKDKQSKIDKILTYFNKPFNPSPPTSDFDKTKLKGIGVLQHGDIFSTFDEQVWPEAIKVLKLLMDAPTFDDFIKTTEALYSHVNEDLLLYVLSVALVNRPDAQGVHIPRVHDIYPDKFITKDVIHELQKLIDQGNKNPIVNDTYDDIENSDLNSRVVYFTEDHGMNSYYYRWHVLYPRIWNEKFGHKDRKGEHFYYMNRQMVARYDAELLSNHKARILPFEDWNQPIKIGYASHLAIERTGYHYASRQDGLKLRDLPELTKRQMRQWKREITTTINTENVFYKNGTELPLGDEHGIDTLANLVAPTVVSINRQFYGNLLSAAHVITARITDPDGKYQQESSVMADAATAARDPLFYSWHKFIDNLFAEYQKSLLPYTEKELTWDDVAISSISIESNEYREEDIIHTFWTRRALKFDKGFDFTMDSEAIVNIKHVDHEDFTYVFYVDNYGNADKNAIFRVFIAPEVDEQGKPLKVKEQRKLMIELDRFVFTLHQGNNLIRRNSNESSVTKPVQEIYGNMGELDDDHCHCGWPEYMLLPRGTRRGMQFNLFVFASDWDEDKATTDTSCHCKDVLRYCGSIYEKYPDKRPMGYPFDRRMEVNDWRDFNIPNMAIKAFTIKFTAEERV